MWSFSRKTDLERARVRARRLYLRWQAEVEARRDLDCGQAMFDLVSPDVRRAWSAFEEAYAEVRRLDPTAPLTAEERKRDLSAEELAPFEGIQR